MADLSVDLAVDVLKTFGMWRLPVDPFAIVRHEGIESAPGYYGDRFDARIEFYPGLNSFCIFHQFQGGMRTEGRVRFSIAHELGHFYLPEHRAMLCAGNMHNSVGDFQSKDPIELQADEFAANLLMPLELFRLEMRSFAGGFCNLRDLSRLADRLGTSITSTARRYCQSDLEPCTVFFSKDGIVRWGVSSTDMKLRRLAFFQFGSAAPRGSKTAELWEHAGKANASGILEGTVAADIWFEDAHADALWEEVMPLGNSGISITQLTPKSS